MTHLINKLRFQVHCSNEEQAFHFRYSFQDSLQEQVAKVVMEICDEYTTEQEYIQIGKIEIDAGDFSEHSIYTDFALLFRQKFREELQRKLSAFSVAQRENSRLESEVNLFIHFIQTGSLPWWADVSEVKIDKLAQDILTRKPQQLLDFLNTATLKQESWTRISYQLDQATKDYILSFFLPLTKARSLFQQWAERLSEEQPDKSWLLSADSSATITDIILRNAPLLFRVQDEPTTVARLFADYLEQIFLVTEKMEKATLASVPDKEKEGIIFSKPDSVTANGDEFQTAQATEKRFQLEPTSRHVVKHAGIILLAPFFQKFFTNLNLYDKSGWTSREAMYRAVHLIKFIATGQQQLPEYTMVLEKLLCGLSPDEPLPRAIELTQAEMAESLLLLQSVLEHWKGVRNTSLMGLRETFLIRDGLVTRKEDGWLLQVERKTLDILLESLPWGYSTVSLPWSEYVIYTEW